VSQLAILILGVSFFSNSISQRYYFVSIDGAVMLLFSKLSHLLSVVNCYCIIFCLYFSETVEEKCYVKVKEDDVLRLAKLILPALNFAISKTRVLFSGEPSMTLKVIHKVLILKLILSSQIHNNC
jgi:hypothetical protein